MGQKNMRNFLRFAVMCLLGTLAGAVDVGISPAPKIQFEDANGLPLAGGLIDTFACGTTTPAATYTDSTGATPNANPIVLDSGGFPANSTSIFLAGCIKFRVKNSASAVQYTIDNINILPPWAVVTNPTGTQTISGAALALNNNFSLLQNTVATAIANQSGNSFCLNAAYWTGAASATDQWCFQDVLGSSSNPFTTLNVTHSGSSGTAVMAAPVFGALPATTVTSAGNPVAVSASPGGTTSGNGGTATMQGGASTSGVGGTARVLGGLSSGGQGGDAQLTAGNAGGSANSNGGAATVTAGNGSTTSGNGGAASLTGGNGANGGTGTGGTAAVTAGNSGSGSTGNGGAVSITAGSSISSNGSGGNIILTPGTKTGTGTAGGIRFDNSILQGSGFKHQRFGATTATGAAAGNTADTTFTWTAAFADASYTATCSGAGPTNVPAIVSIAKSATQITVRVVAITAAAASYSEVHCIAAHD